MWRNESARIVAALTRLVRDVGSAEDLAADAVVNALEDWARTGVPDNPGAWLMTAAKHRAIDYLRRHDRLAEKVQQLGHAAQQQQREAAYDGTAEFTAIADDDGLPDDVLRLMFVACHPVVPMPARVALTLRVVGGLTTEEIARAFLVPEATIAQRIVRAKRMLADRRIPFEVPAAPERADRLASVLEVVYLVFNEGYAATAGEAWVRPQLCDEGLRLGRMLVEQAPGEPEVHGLLALMEIQGSRLRVRVDADGLPVPLAEQDRTRWDRSMIRRGFEALLRAESLNAASAGPYVLQAAIAACHAQAATAAQTDWGQILALYTALEARNPTPVVTLNRAVALANAVGPEPALAVVDELGPALRDYHLLPAVRADLLARLGRAEQARAEFERAAGLTSNESERAALLRRAAGLR